MLHNGQKKSGRFGRPDFFRLNRYGRRLRTGRSSSFFSASFFSASFLSSALSVVLLSVFASRVSLSSSSRVEVVRRRKLGLLLSSSLGRRVSRAANCFLILLNSDVVTTYCSLSGRIFAMLPLVCSMRTGVGGCDAALARHGRGAVPGHRGREAGCACVRHQIGRAHV